MSSRTLLLEVTDGGKKKPDPGVRNIDQSSHHTKGFGNQAGSSSGCCCSMIPRSPRSKRTRRRATCERSDATRKRGLRGKRCTQPPQMVQPYGSNTPGIRANTQCCLTLPSRGRPRLARARPLSNVKHHEGSGDRRSIDSTIRGQRHRAPSRTARAGRNLWLRSGWRPEAMAILICWLR